VPSINVNNSAGRLIDLSTRCDQLVIVVLAQLTAFCCCVIVEECHAAKVDLIPIVLTMQMMIRSDSHKVTCFYVLIVRNIVFPARHMRRVAVAKVTGSTFNSEQKVKLMRTKLIEIPCDQSQAQSSP
jgi:hypothetical protein